MKNKTLIPLSDFVLERVDKITALQIANEVVAYTKFLKQPLTLSMVVPCDEDGNILKKPADDDYSFYTHKNQSVQEEYKEAKEKVLFKGFQLCENNDYAVNYKADLWVDEEFCENTTIEDLVGYDLTLTPYALNQIGLE